MAKKKVRKKIIRVFILLIIVAGAIFGYKAYQIWKDVKDPNVIIETSDHIYIHIPTGSNYNDVYKILLDRNILIDTVSFNWVIKKKNYKNHVKPGRYRIEDGMSNNELVNLLRSGNQEPVKVVLNNIRFKSDLAGEISRTLECDSAELINLLNNPDFASKYGFNTETILTMFIPNTYEMYWNTSSEEFIVRMAEEYKRFWDESRKKKAEKIGLSQSQVSTLASIVQEETVKNDEKDIIAGVYINRIEKGMLLQADPTVKYAVGDFSIRRILKKHLKIDSKYNTYKYKGLPPGPICLPDISSIDAVLNYDDNDYIFFCAKEDFSGYHNFAKTLRQHNINARKYQRALNKKRILK